MTYLLAALAIAAAFLVGFGGTLLALNLLLGSSPKKEQLLSASSGKPSSSVPVPHDPQV